MLGKYPFYKYASEVTAGLYMASGPSSTIAYSEGKVTSTQSPGWTCKLLQMSEKFNLVNSVPKANRSSTAFKKLHRYYSLHQVNTGTGPILREDLLNPRKPARAQACRGGFAERQQWSCSVQLRLCCDTCLPP